MKVANRLKKFKGILGQKKKKKIGGALDFSNSPGANLCIRLQ